MATCEPCLAIILCMASEQCGVLFNGYQDYLCFKHVVSYKVELS